MTNSTLLHESTRACGFHFGLRASRRSRLSVGLMFGLAIGLCASTAMSSSSFAAHALQAPSTSESDVAAPVRIAWDAQPTHAFEGQLVRLRLRVLLERSFTNERALPLFARPVDVPVQVQLGGGPPWSEEGWLASSSGSDVSTTKTIALDEGVASAFVRADEASDGGTYEVLELVLESRAAQAGTFALPSARAQYAFATRFADDLLQGRVPLDRNEASVVAPARSFEIEPLPVEGRPLEFEGLVGRFELRARAADTAFEVGRGARIDVIVDGDRALSRAEAPHFDAHEFSVRGMTSTVSGTRTTFVYDLAPERDGARVIPSFTLATFDPVARAYRTVASEPLAVRVEPSRVDRDRPRADATTPVTQGEGGSGYAAAGKVFVLVALAVVIALSITAYVARSVAQRRSARKTARVAGDRFRANAERGDVAELLTEFLATRLDIAPAAVVAPDLRARLSAAGIPDALAQRTVDLLEALVAARFGGSPPHSARERARVLVDELELAFALVEA